MAIVQASKMDLSMESQAFETIEELPLAESSSPMREPPINLEEDAASFSGSARHSSGPDEAVFDAPTRTSSPRTSHASSEDEISILETCDAPPQRPSGLHTPLKQRSPFRNPSSVRAMQLETTPPHLSSSRHSKCKSRRLSTPRSARAMNGSPTKQTRKEHPLVLLHVTLLPVPYEYPQSVLQHVLPPTILRNWELLMEKTSPTVLHRGVLIPHPREDYDLLEERLLESLELKQPRVLKCGHFHLSPEEEADIDVYEDQESEDEAVDADICQDCGRRIRNGRYGDTGTGSKRWDVKVFAANGLMRAGAWHAAWREMERVDVEILPWMEESMRRELEGRNEEEERIRQEEDQALKEEGVGGLDDERLKEIYGQESASFIDGLDRISRRASAVPVTPRRHSDIQRQQQEVPLWDLFVNYCFSLAQDRRNIAILLLSLLICFLAIRAAPSASTASESISEAIPEVRVSTDMIQTSTSVAFSTTYTVEESTSDIPIATQEVVVESSVRSEIQENGQEVEEEAEEMPGESLPADRELMRPSV